MRQATLSTEDLPAVIVYKRHRPLSFNAEDCITPEKGGIFQNLQDSPTEDGLSEKANQQAHSLGGFCLGLLQVDA